jgi:uncharacterized iron-regulated protein
MNRRPHAMNRKSLVLAPLILLSLSAEAAPLATQESTTACGQPGLWLQPASPMATPVAPRNVLDRLTAQQVVLLGEKHDREIDHRWQLGVMNELHKRRPDMAIGFEMFPRRLQPVLDRWVAGELSEAEFLKQAQWGEVWDSDAQLYLPLFQFARQHRLPMLALNVERSLVRQTGERGWEAVPEAKREGVSRPAPPVAAYRDMLKGIFEGHAARKNDDSRFDRFVEAQALWDRAMAEAIAAHLRSNPQRLVVAIVGAGHIQHGYGVPHQLKALGITRQASLLTWPGNQPCTELVPGLADAVFVIPPEPHPANPPPRLGVRLNMAENGVLIEEVWADSLAERTGLKTGDVVVQAAGRKLGGVEEFRSMVQNQPAGTWLPLLVHRGKDVLNMIVRFPAKP